MSYVLEAEEQLASGLKRIAGEQADRALESLRHRDADADEAIHDARKRFKKIRAVLRLVRDEIGEEVYKRENVFYRDLGRDLAGVRDSYVKVATVAALRARYEGYLEEDALAATQQRLQEAHETLCRRVLVEEDVPEQVITALDEVRPRLDALPIGREDFGAIDASIRRVYKRGYRGCHNAYEEPVPENFHEWRKRVKYLWYHLRILNPLWPDLFATWADAVHDLSDYLGDAHDLSELRALVQSEPDLCPDEKTKELLLGLADRRRGELEAAAYPLGRRIYSEEPEDFVQRMAGYWHAWRQEGAVAAAEAVISSPD